MQPFDAWIMEEYWERQLPNILIAEFKSRFRKPMQSAAFSGGLSFLKVTQRRERRPLLVIDTDCRFWDESGECADGVVKLAITNPPSHRRRSLS